MQVRLFPAFSKDHKASTSQQASQADDGLAELQGPEHLWTAVTPSGSLILAPRWGTMPSGTQLAEQLTKLVFPNHPD